ncbi:MAG: hypothetical protein GY953_18270 [bacterium]|nr:hypothetical protein [bacterium]
MFPSIALFFTTAALILAKTGRDALYFQEDGLMDLPGAYLGLALLSAPFALSAIGSMKLLGPRRARLAALLAYAAVLAACYRWVQPGGGIAMTLFFMLVPLAFGVVLSLVWLLGADLLEHAPSFVLPRLYSTLGAASMVGGLSGAALGKLLAGWISPQSFLLMSAACLVMAAVVVAMGQDCCPALRDPGKPAPAPDQPARGDTGRQRYVALLAAAGVLGSLVGVLIEFQFYWTAASSGRGSQENLQFFASFYMFLNAASLLVQVFLMPLLQRKLGVHGSLMILPAVLSAGSAALAVTASGLMRAGLRVTEGGLKSSIHRSNWEQAYLPLSREVRTRAKLLVDGMATHMGEGVAAVLLLVWLRGAGVSGAVIIWSTYTLIGASILWVLLTVGLGRALQRSGLGTRDLKSDVPVTDGCLTTATLGAAVQQNMLSQPREDEIGVTSSAEQPLSTR